MSGESEKILRASFCGAANHLTQLYMVSLKQEKMAYKRGYCDGIETIMRSLQQLQQQRNSTTISIDVLVEILNNKKREIAASLEESATEQGEEEEKPMGSSQQQQSNHHGFNGSSSTGQPTQPQFGAPSIPSPFQQPSNTPSFGQPSTNVSTQPQFTFGTTMTQQPPPSFPSIVSTSTAATFTQAVSNSIPFPSVPFPRGSLSSSGSRKRHFFEYLFDSTPSMIPTLPPGPAPPPDYLSLFGQPQHNTTDATTTTTASATSNDSDNGEMDFSSYPTTHAVWKRSRLDEPLIIQNNG